LIPYFFGGQGVQEIKQRTNVATWVFTGANYNPGVNISAADYRGVKMREMVAIVRENCVPLTRRKGDLIWVALSPSSCLFVW
jgi:hypothetical protein